MLRAAVSGNKMRKLSCLCFFLTIITSYAQDGTDSYQQIRFNSKKVEEISENLDFYALWKLEQKMSKVLDMEKVMQSVARLGDDGNKLKYRQELNINLPAPPVAQLQTTPKLPIVSPKCLNHSQSIILGLTQSKSWATKMIDAVGKPPSGILAGRLTWVGNYAECIGADAKLFHGKYCAQTFWVPIQNPITRKKGATLIVGVCMPDTCSNNDVNNMFSSVIGPLSNNTVYAIGSTCQELDLPYDTRAIAVLTVIAIFIALMVIATTYDVIRRQMSKSKDNSLKEEVKSTSNGAVNVAYISDEKMSEARPDIQYKMKELVESVTIGEKDSVNCSPGLFGKLLLSFSVYTNGEKILSTRQGGGTLTAINGIRFISMTWVILGHTYAFGFPYADNLADVFLKFIRRKSFMAILNAEVSVDSFFALSGTLLTYLVLKQLKNGKGKLNWFMFYFHRFWRLTPPYMLVMMVYISLYAYLGSGPAWHQDGHEKDHCETTWWYNLLYINNFKKGGNECFAWAWYLANDMQFFVLSPILIMPMYHSKIAGTIVTGVFLLGTTIATGVISTHYKLHARQEGDYFDEYYQRPYCRMGPYLVGMYTGFLLYRMKCKCNINKYLNLALWVGFAAAACAVLYGVYDENNGNEMSIPVAALYNAVHKTVWGAAVCWVIFACATGNGGFINTILSWKAFVPLGRLTYCAYLVHPIIQYYYYESRKQLMYWDDHEIIYLYLGHLGIAYACAFVTSLAFEAPMMGLEKVIFKRDKGK